MNTAEMRLLSTTELLAKLTDAREELMNLRFQVINGQLTDTSRLKQTRRLIARFATILAERESAGKEGA